MNPLQPQAEDGSRGETPFAIAVTAAFALVSGAVMTRHEMWSDELQAWMISRDATGLVSLWHNLRYEGHPGLWHLLLFILSRFTRNPAAMQGLHLALAVAGIFIFVRFARLPRLHRILYAFGFFPLYQYAVVSRCYMLGVLLVMGYCALVTTRRHTGALGATLLALLANTSVYGWLLAFSLGIVLLAPEAFRAPFTWRRLTPVAVFVGGLAVAMVTMHPPADSGVGVVRAGLMSGHVLWSWDLAGQALRQAGATYLSPSLPVPAGVAIAVLVVGAAYFVLAFARQGAALAVYLTSLVGMLAFKCVVYMGAPWHNGHFLIALVASWWLYAALPQHALRSRRLDAVSRACKWALPGVMAVSLGLHVASVRHILVQDWREPYSGGQSVAQFIASGEFRDADVLGDADAALSSVCGYLDRPVYYLTSETWGTFVTWNDKRRPIEGDQDELIERVRRAPIRGPRGALVLDYELTPAATTALDARLVYISPPAICAAERFWVYDLPRT